MADAFPGMQEDDRELMLAVSRYLQHVNSLAQRESRPTRTPLGDIVSAHLGADAAALPVVRELISDHRLVDADIALDLISTETGGSLIGMSGGEQRLHVGMSELMSHPHGSFAPGPVDYAERSTGPASSRRVVAMGLRLLDHDGRPLAVVQRAAAPQRGQPQAVLEVMGEEADTVSSFLERVRALMLEHSVLRRQVLSFTATEYGRDAGATFLPRPNVGADDVILAEGVLEEVVGHVVGIGEHRDALRAAGQHLKRGVLLYGPPGTGKTLTVRHLLSRTLDTTVVLLTGSGIRFIGAAAEIARTFQPSVVVMEDIDLVAMERNASPQPLLFEVLDALDGLDGDADVAFVMTTNRVEVLERALAERPGRVDLAVEISLPALAQRERLLRHYAARLRFTDDALIRAALQTEGTTGSFAKELIRRSVMHAAVEDREPADGDLEAALAELLDARQRLTRGMLGATGEAPQQQNHGPVTVGGFGYQPLA